jgi:hypothetical protein
MTETEHTEDESKPLIVTKSKKMLKNKKKEEEK